MAQILREIGSTVAKLRAALDHQQPDDATLLRLRDSLRESLPLVFEEINLQLLRASSDLWREFLSLVASGKIIAVVARTEERLNLSQGAADRTWMGSGLHYSRWLARGAVLAQNAQGNPSWPGQNGQLLSKALGLGYSEIPVEGLLDTCLPLNDNLETFSALTASLEPFEQRRLIISLLSILQRRVLSSESSAVLEGGKLDKTTLIATTAAIIKLALESVADGVLEQMLDHLTKHPLLSVDMMRAIAAALSIETRESLVTNLWQAFGNRLLLRHRPVVHSQAVLNFLCIVLGYVHRVNRMHIFLLARSSTHTAGVSEHLKSPSARIRFQGISLSLLVSRLIDSPDVRMQYALDQEEREEFNELCALAAVDDCPSTIADAAECLRKLQQRQGEAVTPKATVSKFSTEPSRKAQHETSATPKIVLVEEVDEQKIGRCDNKFTTDDDLKPLVKPGPDPRDSEEDASLLDRDQIRAPVYLRELFEGLQSSDNHKAFRVALLTAPSLIARKAAFGKELQDVVNDLASLLASLRDPVGFDDFEDLQRAALAALIIAAPEDATKVCIAAYWHGDNSMAQRLAILQAVGVAALELSRATRISAGGNQREQSFATDQLSERLHRLYLTSYDSAPGQQAAWTTKGQSGHGRTTRFGTEFAKVVANTFFFPLLNGWQLLDSPKRRQQTRGLGPAFVRTLTLLLRCGGRTSVLLRDMLREFWAFLQSIRAATADNTSMLEASLSGLLAVFELDSEPRALAEQQGRQLLETYEWTHLVFENTLDEDAEGQQIKAQAAAVLIRVKEIMDAYERLLIGDAVAL